MRCSIFLLVCFLSFNSQSQTGSILVNCIDQLSNNPLVVCMDVKSDTTIIDHDCSDISGVKKFSNLPKGFISLNLKVEDSLIAEKLVFVQENQLLQVTIRINASGNSIISNGAMYDVSASGEDKTPRPQPSPIQIRGSRSGAPAVTSNNLREVKVDAYKIASLPPQQLASVVCVAYRQRIININDPTITYKYSSEDINNMPLRSPIGIASTVGGARLNEETGELNVRGARSDANIFYLDGMRVQSLEGIPKSYIGQMTVYTGGIPANFGDVTGGVIAMNSRPIRYETSRYINYYTPKRYKRVRKPYIPRAEPDRNTFSLDRFTPIYENDFLSPIGNPNSTFSIDVDRASWTYVQNQFKHGLKISRDAVKLEEMINAFSYKEVTVPKEELMNVELERSACSWNEQSQLVTIHLKAKDLEKDSVRKPHNFVFLIDVSGSMQTANKIELLKNGLIKFVETLKENDRVSIVTYAGYSGVVLEPTLCKDKKVIVASLSRLTAGGSTNGIGGISTAYTLAEQNYNPELNNRIILCTDGDFNVGINDPSELEEYISTKRGTGIYLTALGFGMGNYRNDILETLADRGDGNHFYIKDLDECKKVLVDEMGNLINIARDVKLNVEFNPKYVSEYRLIGYENRLLKPRDFRDDTKDAGEMGYGHKVTAVYEIVLGKAEVEKTSFTKSKSKGINNSDLAIVKLRYKSFEDSSSVERQYSLSVDEELEENKLLNTVISFGLQMRNSAFKGEMTKKGLSVLAKNVDSKSEDVVMLKKMIDKYAKMD